MAFSTLQKMLSLVSLLLLVMLICSDHVSSHSNEETQALLTNSSTHLGTATSPCKWYGILQPCRECHQNKPHRVHQCVKVRLPPMCNSERYQSKNKTLLVVWCIFGSKNFYKLLAKVLASRLKKVNDKVV